MDEEQIQKKLNDLFVRYSKTLPEKIHDLEIQWQAQQKQRDHSGFQNFHRDVHSLCGSAGTYGFTELSKTARKMEILLKEMLANEKITAAEQEQINSYFYELKGVLAQEIPNKPSKLSDEINVNDNKFVYILEKEETLVRDLEKDLKLAGYFGQHLNDISLLINLVRERPPLAMIIDTDYLNLSGLNELISLQQTLTTPIPLFCIVPDANLLPRLTAIRANCVSFFQKPLDASYLVQELNINCGSSVNKAYRILILDDSKSLAEYYSLILKEADMITKAITNPLNLLKELEKFQPDLLLMDVYMPDCSGLELATLLRKDRKYTKLPIIFLSTEDDKNKKLAAISLGGDDFLTKPISPHDLISAVRSRSNRASILNYYMTTDSLTGLLNHSSILNRLTIEIERAKQQKTSLSFVMLDIDHFKLINDNYGHPFGDIVIKKLASFLMVSLRNRDIIGRYGGEEFALILPNAGLEDSYKICNDLKEQFSQSFFTVNEQKVQVTISGGISSLNENSDVNTMVIQADEALYKAKRSGRNAIQVFN